MINSTLLVSQQAAHIHTQGAVNHRNDYQGTHTHTHALKESERERVARTSV